MAVFEVDETQRATRHRPLLLQLPGLDLVAVEGPARGVRSPVVGNLARVGSAEGNQLRLHDPSVSRIHCEIHVSPSAISLVDCGSTNGTYVGSIRIARGEVPVGTLVRLGDSAFRIEESGAPSPLLASTSTSFGELIGESFEMRTAYALLERLAQNDTTLLVLGETGTGKDVAARSLHQASTRKSGPFVPVDCGAIPEHLFESELFGHVRGAFTGATHNRKGVFEEAHGGTLFLDEIGELPLAMQAKLLRALETRSVRRVGSNTATPIDVRIVAATNVPLAQSVNAGTFREDLYYRLAVVELQLPPLRARHDDVALLANRFHRQLTGSNTPLPDAFIARLSSRSWPGNVRELKNHVERAVTLGTIDSDGPPPQIAALAGGAPTVPLHLPLKEAREDWIARFELAYVRGMLQRTAGNVTHAAALAGVSRRFLQRTLVRLGVDKSEVVDVDDE